MTVQIPVDNLEEPRSDNTMAFMSAGFRPFFLFAGVYAVAPLFAWLWAFLGDGETPGDFAPSYWHSHEMVFGFVVAAVTGFLLTAVPNWTRTRPFKGLPLFLLVGVWVLGRLAMWFGWPLGPHFVAVVDLAMIPLLTLYIGRRLVAHNVRRNYIVLGILSILFVANLMMHLEAMGLLADSAGFGLNMGIYGTAILLTLISGRVIPGFTANALRRGGLDVEAGTPTPVTRLVIFLVVLAALFDLFAPDAGPARFAAGGVAGLAALALLVRMRQWHSLKTLGDPIVWILHVGHFWLVLAFALLALATFSDGLTRDAGLHALSAGAFGTMIMAMMTRAALGHSGREIKASPAIALAYVMVIIGALLRVVASVTQLYLAGDGYNMMIGASGLLWAGAFAIFSVVFWPILTRPRL